MAWDKYVRVEIMAENGINKRIIRSWIVIYSGL